MKSFFFNLLVLPLAAIMTVACSDKEAETRAQMPELQTEVTPELIFSDVKVPWSVAWLPNGDMLIAERSGSLLRVRNGELISRIEGVPEVFARGQGGLLDVVLHPDYEENGWIYISYSSPEGEGQGANTSIIRGKLTDNVLTGKETIYEATPNTTRGVHYGSRIVFDSDNYLYFSIGDRGRRDEYPQDLTIDAGKIYRLHDDGSVPADNPFVNEEDAVAAVFSYGHRNPQGMAIHPETGAVWAHEHGPQGGDELNLVEAGKNYGWPVISYGRNYNGTSFTDLTEKEGMEQPKTYWTPSIAPSGLTFVTSDKYPEWQGKALVGSLKFGYLVLVSFNGNEVTKREIVLDGIGRTRDVRQGPDGYIYVAVDGDGIYRINP